MEKEAVLDASILLATLKGEYSQVDLLALIKGGIISVVNLSEVYAKAAEFGLTDSPHLRILVEQLGRIEPFTADQARRTADLRLPTWNTGLGLGDRAFLALGLSLGADVYTADALWAKLDLPCKIHLIR